MKNKGLLFFGIVALALVTPHAAYYSEESIRTARETAATQVAKVLTGETAEFSVNAEALATAN